MANDCEFDRVTPPTPLFKVAIFALHFLHVHLGTTAWWIMFCREFGIVLAAEALANQPESHLLRRTVEDGDDAPGGASPRAAGRLRRVRGFSRIR